MNNLKDVILFSQLNSTIDYFNKYKQIRQELKKNRISYDKKIKIAVLSSFTINGLKEVLFVKCAELGIFSEFYIADYNQYSQEILDINSGLYKFNPDLIILFVDIQDLMGKYYFEFYQLSEHQRNKLINEKLTLMEKLIYTLTKNSSAKIIINNFKIPPSSPFGILENKQKEGFIENIQKLNFDITKEFKSNSQVFIFDYDSFCGELGKDNAIDYKLYYLGDIKLNLDYLPRLSDCYLSYIKPLTSLTRKCIVLDLDNTLWGGIIGEDGIEGIQLGPTPEGRPFLEFQKYLLSLFNKGVILAINSRNNLDDALAVFKKHPHMVLKEEHFAAMKINWNDKISNMKNIAQEINIGLDSIVFFDDDKFNREIIRDALPEVLVIDLPSDPSLYLKTLMQINDFNTLQITEEDKKKGKIYADQRKRETLKESVVDITEYLKKLEMIVTIEKADFFNIPRISQLTMKTNQFNMTTRRYSEEKIKEFGVDKNYLVVSVKVEDKFGDNGISGVAIIKKEKAEWKIDTFLLSCRIIGRKVDETLLGYIIDQAKKANIKAIVGEFIPTKKNLSNKNFYKNNHFVLAKKEKNRELWKYDINLEYNAPDFIKVVKK